MKVGFTFEEKILKEITLEKYITFIKKQNVDFIEFAVDLKNYSFEFYKKIFEKIKIKKHFHLPHFADENLDITNYSNDNFKKISNYYDILAKLNKNENTNMIFHGATYKNNKKQAFKKTYEFINKSINYINKNNLNINLSIETLDCTYKNVIGNQIKDIKKLSDEFDKLNICIDLIHLFYSNQKKIKKLSDSFFKKVNHYHIHGFKNNKKHIPINDKDSIKKIIKNHPIKNTPITIELLICDNYLKNLKKDITFLKTNLKN
ncbi:MAG: TIM barrel protein [Bacillota bacterium]